MISQVKLTTVSIVATAIFMISAALIVSPFNTAIQKTTVGNTPSHVTNAIFQRFGAADN